MWHDGSTQYPLLMTDDHTQHSKSGKKRVTGSHTKDYTHLFTVTVPIPAAVLLPVPVAVTVLFPVAVAVTTIPIAIAFADLPILLAGWWASWHRGGFLHLSAP
jgi:hypothetical protein